MEQELKFALEPRHAGKLKACDLLQSLPPETKSFISIYFDTDALAFHKAGLSLRLRVFDDHTVQTLKLPSARPTGFFVREEYESRIAGTEPDLDHLRAHCPAALRETLKAFPLREVFRVEMQRTEWLIHFDKSAISVVLDDGLIKGDTRSEPIHEVEIELQDGRIEDIFSVARRLAARVPLRLEVVSKAERGYRLVAGDGPKAEKAPPIRLDRKMTAAAGFQTIASLCIQHFAANERVFLATCAPDALHQMRVALRRLRSLMSFFDSMLSAKQTAMLRVEIGRAFKKLGAARDLDVLLATLAESGVQAQSPALLAEIHGHRDAAYKRVLALLRSRRFCSSMLDLLTLVECGAQARNAGKRQSAEKLDVTGASILEAQRRKLRKFGSVPGLDARKRHKLRIQAKKLRYACEFFGDLFKKPKARHRRKDLAKTVEELQETLGALNDRVFMRQMFARWGGAAAAAAGVASPDGRSEQELIEAADASQTELEKQKPFWS